jgi:hypothetical protein
MAIGNLTQDRPSYTAAELNECYETAIATLVASLPNGLTANGADLNTVDLEETDEGAAGIETPDDILAYVAWLGMTYNVEESNVYGGIFNTDASWIAGWRTTVTDIGETAAELEFVLSIFDFLENQYASGSGLNLTELGVNPPREYATQWTDQATRISDMLQDQAMFFGNQYVQGGAVYNTARIGQSVALDTAIKNANNITTAARLSAVTSGNLGSLAVTTKLLPFQTQSEYMLTSGGGNPQQIPALSGGNSSPFNLLKGFAPSFRNSVSAAPSQVNPLSYQGNQQQISFNSGSSTTPVYKLFIGQDTRTQIGQFGYTVGTGAALDLKVTTASYTPDNSAIGGFTGTLLSIENWEDDNFYLQAGATLAIEEFEEFTFQPADLNTWGYPAPDVDPAAFENFSTGWPNGSRSALDRPLNCGSGGGADGSIFSEDLSAQADGSTTSYTTTQLYTAETLRVYRNGQRQGTTQITETGPSTFSTSFTASAGEVIIVDYTPQ